jgi:alpha,alpha-trehalase
MCAGWDFSSRWFGDEMSIGTIRTTDIVPVDLNAIMYRMEHNIASLAARRMCSYHVSDCLSS